MSKNNSAEAHLPLLWRKCFNWALGPSFSTQDSSWHWDEPRHGVALLTQCLRRTVVSPNVTTRMAVRWFCIQGPTAKSLRFLAIYHCKCLIYLVASVQCVFIITLILEGRYLGLLLSKDIFVVWAPYVYKREQDTKSIWSLFLVTVRGKEL